MKGCEINGLNQWLWADAFYFHRLDDDVCWQADQRLLKLAGIFHCIYESYDFSAHVLKRYDPLAGESHFDKYIIFLRQAGICIDVVGDDEARLAEMIKQCDLS